jgi:coenzyme F420 hydrogenase subunit beta
MGTHVLAYATDATIRKNATSGGFTKAFLSFLLDQKIVDGLLVVRTGTADRFAPEAVILESKEDLFSPRYNSVYYPVDPLAKEPELDPQKKYAATLLPCQINRLHQLQRVGRLKNIHLVVGLVCNHVPPKKATEALIYQMGYTPDQVTHLTYRGNGWPGGATVNDRKIPLERAWGIIGRTPKEPCIACALIEPNSDLIVCDPWGVKASMGDGKTVVKINNFEGLVLQAEQMGYIKLESFPEETFAELMAVHRLHKKQRMHL